MSGTKRSHLDKLAAVDALISVGQWVAKAWPVIASILGGGGMSYLASLNPSFSPLQWGLIGVGTSLTIYLTLIAGVAGWSWAASKRATARFSEGAINTITINPLDTNFEKKRINLHDFEHPVFQKYSNTSFVECEIFGGGMAFSGIPRLDRVQLADCNIVVVMPGKPSLYPIFESPRFLRCKLYRVTLYLTANVAQTILAVEPNIPVISDGNCGDLREK